MVRAFIRQRFSARLIIKLAVIIAAVALAVLPLPAALVERFYTNGFYLRLQSVLTPLSNLLPFALIDLLMIALIVGLPAWWVARIWKARRGERLRALALASFNTLVLAAAAFLSFQLLWGLNYLREPLTDKLEYDEGRLTADARAEFIRATVERLNADAAPAHQGAWPGDEELRNRLHQSLDTTVRELGNDRGIARAIPKPSIIDFYLGATGISGFTNPFGLEIIINSDLLPVEMPFTIAHEWAHLAGFADESEANFVALVACARSDVAAVRYSGWLALYSYLPPPQADAPPLLAPEVIADLQAINERERRRVNAEISRAQARMYDQFLKANRVEAGIASYGLFIRLLLGTRFEQGWTAARRSIE